MHMSTKAASKVVKQLAGSGTGQSLMDRVTQAKFSLAGSGLGKVVAKATTEEIGAPKKKHIDYLVNCSNEPNVSIPLLAGLLVERTQEKSWVIVFKALITTHNLMNFGNEKFSHYLASNNCPLHLPNFNDKTSAQSYEMSLFIRRYSHYISEKTASYRAMAFDFCKVKRGRDDGVLRTMPIDKLLKALPVLALQITTLLEFDAHEKDLNNTIINAAFLLLYKDLVRLFASYNEGMINLIEKYFTLKLKECRLGMELYHNFPGILDKITEFLTLAESLGIGDKDSLGLQPVPEKVIHAMEQHLAILESKKGSDDEDDTNIDHPTPSRPTPPKKPTVTVPLPVTKPTVSKPKSAEHQPADLIVPVPEKTPTVDTSTVDTVEGDIETSKPEADAGGEDDDQHAAYPTVVVNDEEGLPSTLQEEIIAAATSHLAETIDRSNEAVKRSAKQTTISPIHTQLGRSEHRTIPVHSGPPSRSRSPSPGRPVSRPMTIPTHEIVNSASDTDLKAHAPAPSLSSGGGSSYQNLSVHGLNEATDGDGGASPICGSPFEGDEKIVEPATGVEDWPEAADEPQSKFDTQFGTPTQNAAKPPALTQTTTGSSVMDDLLGLDLLATGPDDTTPIPVPTPIAPTTSVTPTSGSIPSVGAANDTSKSALILDDLLSLDPLMGAMDPVPPPTIPATATQILGADGSINLPPGLKQVNPNMPIRPVAPAAPASKNALDSLDSTLMNLASSLGGQQGWGSSQTKKRPISDTSKPQ